VPEGRDAAPAARQRPAAAPRRRGRTLAWLLAVLIVVVAGAVAGVLYIRTQYYVGFDGDDVAVFRGVQGGIGGLEFHTVAEKSLLTRSQLSDVEAERVDDGIPAAGKSDAHDIVKRLIDETQCARATPAPTPTATASPAPSVGPVPCS
jgi:protein phosphatase